MQRQTKWALGLLAALGTVACGSSSDDVGDKYQGVVDASALDTKFKAPSCGSTCAVKGTTTQYGPTAVNANGVAFSFYNLGTVSIASKKTDGTFNANGVPTDSAGRPILPASLVVGTSYDFADGCTVGATNFDPRTAVYPETAQWSVFDKLPLAPSSTSTSTPFILPLVHVKSWTGTGGQKCNDIKSADSLTAGTFGGAAADGDTLALRAIIDVSVPFLPLRDGSGFAPAGGWYRGLLLNWLDGGTAAVDADGNVKTMDGVLVSPPSGSTEPAAYVFQAQPGDAAWSPVVRLRTFTAPNGTKAASYKSLCYDPPCAADGLNMTNINKYSGVLFVVGSTL